MRKSSRSIRPARRRVTARSTARSSRARTSDAPARASTDRRRGHQARRVSDPRSESSGVGVGRRVSARARRGRHRRHRRRAGAPSERGVSDLDHAAASVRHREGGRVERRLCRPVRHPRQADRRRRGPLPPAPARRSRGDRRWIRHGLDRRPVAHRPRRLPVSAADAHHLRLGRSGAPERPGVLDARCGRSCDRVGAGSGNEPGAARLARAARRADRSPRRSDAGAASSGSALAVSSPPGGRRTDASGHS